MTVRKVSKEKNYSVYRAKNHLKTKFKRFFTILKCKKTFDSIKLDTVIRLQKRSL